MAGMCGRCWGFKLEPGVYRGLCFGCMDSRRDEADADGHEGDLIVRITELCGQELMGLACLREPGHDGRHKGYNTPEWWWWEDDHSGNLLRELDEPPDA